MRKKILVVDDDPSLVNLLKESLEGEGYQVQAAYEGGAALGLIEGFKPDALIVDVNMPGINGIETLSRLRQNAATASLPVLLLTGESDMNLARDSATVYLEKPIDLDVLSGHLVKLFKNS